MSVNVRIEGENFIDLGDEIVNETLPVVKQLAKAASKIFLTNVQRRLRGRIAARGAASAEGEAPNYQSGDLYRSFDTASVRVLSNVVQAGIKSSEPHEKVNSIEYGHVSKGGVHVGPRPFLRPAEEAIRPEIDALAESML